MKGKLKSDVIVQRRLELDYSQKYLSEKTGVSLNVIKSIETGRTIGNITNLKKICDELGLNIDEIYLPDFRNTKVFAFVQNKGGDGKTSICGSLAYALSEYGTKDNKILLIDANPQYNLTRSYGLDKSAKLNLGEAIRQDEDISKFVQPTPYKNIDMVVAHPSMSSLEMFLLTKIGKENSLKNIMRNTIEKGIYDYIFIDTDNHLGIMNYNILNASDYIIIPVCYTAFSLDGLQTLLDHVELVRKSNADLKIAGIVVNKYDLRKKQINIECEELIKQVFRGINIFNTKISLDSTIERAQFNSIPVLIQDKNSRIAKNYKDLAKEVAKVAE